MRRLLQAFSIPALVTASRYSHASYLHPEPHIHLGSSIPAHASFEIPCSGCLGLARDGVVTFDFKAYPSKKPCGTNFTLNGRRFNQGNGSSHVGTDALEADFWSSVEYTWTSDCLYTKPSSLSVAGEVEHDTVAQVLTVQITSVDQRKPLSPSGFTLSFQQGAEPKLLRLQLFPASPPPTQPSEEWRDPPAALRIDSLLAIPPLTDTRSRSQASIDYVIRRIKRLEQQRAVLDARLKDEEAVLQNTLLTAREGLRAELQTCYSWYCGAKAVGTLLNGAVHSLILRLHPDHYRYSHNYFVTQAAGGYQQTNMFEKTWSLHDIEKPKPAYLGTYNSDGYQEIADPVPWGSRSHTQSSYRQHRRKNPFITALKVIAAFLGLAALLAIFRRRFSSLRRRTSRATEHGEQRAQHSYRRAARRAAFKKWCFGGWRRNQDARRIIEYEEKRALVIQGESRLEAAMQDEICNLCSEASMSNEISEFQQAHGVVDELVRAEEGRASPVRPYVFSHYHAPGIASIAGMMMGREHVPAHIAATLSSYSSNGSPVMTPATTVIGHPLSRTDSLPAYRTEPDSDSDDHSDGRSIFSDIPPSYRTDEDSSDSESEAGPSRVAIVTNGFTQYHPDEFDSSMLSPSVDGASIFTPASSIPDISPRDSRETGRTFA